MYVKMRGIKTVVYRDQATAAFSNGGTASNETNDKKKRAHSNYHHGRDESVDILKKMIIVIIRDENIGPNVAQYTCSSLGKVQQKNC